MFAIGSMLTIPLLFIPFGETMLKKIRKTYMKKVYGSRTGNVRDQSKETLLPPNVHRLSVPVGVTSSSRTGRNRLTRSRAQTSPSTPPPIVYLARPCSGLWRLPLRGLSRTARAGLISYEAEIVYILRLGYGITSGKILETEIGNFYLKSCCYNIL